MENTQHDSFSGRNGYKKNETFPSLKSPSPYTLAVHRSSFDYQETKQQQQQQQQLEQQWDDQSQDLNMDQIAEDIARFTEILTAADDKSKSPPEAPDAVETFSKVIESRLFKYYAGKKGAKFGKVREDDLFFIHAVERLSKLTNTLSDFPLSSSTTSSLNLTSVVLQRALSFMEEEFRALLEDSRPTASSNATTTPPVVLSTTKFSSFNNKHGSFDGPVLPEAMESTEGEDDFPGYLPEVVTRMGRLAAIMVTAGYELECRQVYTVARRIAFFEQLKKLEFEKLNVEDVQKMHWEPLEIEVVRWIKVVKECTSILFPGERILCESVFSEHPSISQGIFSNLVSSVVVQLLDFVHGVSMTKRSTEKVFKFLDLHEALSDVVRLVSDSRSNDCDQDLRSEITTASDRIGEAVVGIFSDLENSIRNDAGRTPVPGGAVHPLTRYVMNYLKYACEYKDTLEQIFEKHANRFESENERESLQEIPHRDEMPASSSPFSLQLVTVMDMLDANLEAKSGLYKDVSLRYIFLMNNGRYILQKVKGSTEIHQVMGDTWCRRRSTVVRQFHKNYQRETWGRLLQCLSHDGLQTNGKVCKPVLKERFKIFSNTFDEIHKTQSTWVVSDEQLLSELRVSITAVVIPAYRSFLGRFRQYLDRAEKYIKYQPEDIETLIEGLFEGNPTSMARRR